mmetsp:Transcript_56278/g.163181  ORF Transcript_56278/g.163181 Transcript_56278/m.163181 type:complete len:261 (+) Transcript_56278:82-864(+)
MLSGGADDDPFAALDALEEAVAASQRHESGSAVESGAPTPHGHRSPGNAAAGLSLCDAAPSREDMARNEVDVRGEHGLFADDRSAANLYDRASPAGWDTDDDPGPMPRDAPASAMPRGSANFSDAAPLPAEPSEELGGGARISPGAAAQASATFGDDDLDDLVGELLGDSSLSAQYSMVPGFHCMGCDLQVMRAHDFAWEDGVEYLFLRNNYPEFQKLKAQLKQRGGFYAYCCQCSSRSALMSTDLADVADGLRWRVVAH